MNPLCSNSGSALPPIAARLRRLRGGFALLLTVTLLAFAGLLLLSLATLTRIETVTVANARRAAEARQNALLSLHVAIGRLQRFAGADQRVTARADLLPESVGNPYWTGVWDATSASRVPLTWLVSGNENHPLALTPDLPPVADPALDNESVWLLRTPVGGAAQRIKLERQPLSAAGLPGFDGTCVVGHYAWWVGDEGVKARFNLVSSYAGASAGTAENMLEFMSAQQFGLEQLTESFAAYAIAKGKTAAGTALRGHLGRILTPEQIVYADPSFSLAAVRDRFHDLTTCSQGVLANVAAGGLKKDLTRGLEAGAAVPEGPVFSGGPDWALVRSYYQLRPSFVNGGWQIPPRSQSPVQHGVHPVVVLAQIVWGGDRVGGKFRLLFRPLVVLGNPYQVALAPADYRLIWRQDGAIELRTPPGVADGQATSGTPAQLLGEELSLLIPQAGFLPGEARVFTLTASGDHQIPYARGAGLALTAGFSEASSAFVDLATAADPMAMAMQVRVAGGMMGFEFCLGDGTRLQEVAGCAANAPDCAGSMPFLGAPVRVGLRLSDSIRNSPDDVGGSRWLASFNLRAPELGSLASWGRNPQYDAATPRGGDDNTILGGNDVFWGPSHRAADGGQRLAALFDLPGADLHSLAQLQHANLQPVNAGPACTVGHSYADPHTPDGTPDFDYRLNAALWDRFFFSTLPSGSGALPAALPNRRLIYYRPGGLPPESGAARNYDTAAAHLLVDGPFNINSTSVAAWQAALASLNGQSLAWMDPETGTTHLETVASAFLSNPLVNGSASDGWRGYRALSPAEVQRLAAAVVDAIRAHGPFRSLAEFVNRPLTAPAEEARLSGLLQSALDRTVNPPTSLRPAPGLPVNAGPSPALPWPAASRGHVSTLAPGWLSQADLLADLGPVLAARSDTFLVRAYGDAANPATGNIESCAWCEAVVQRVPDYVDAADPPEAVAGLSSTSQTYGRRFQIVRFRWLSASEV
jgi:hypothetical protein